MKTKKCLRYKLNNVLKIISFQVKEHLPPDYFLRSRGDTAHSIKVGITIFNTVTKKSRVISALVTEKQTRLLNKVTISLKRHQLLIQELGWQILALLLEKC